MQPPADLSARARVARLISSIDKAGRSVVRGSRIKSYVRRGCVPWSRGYSEYRAEKIGEALADEALLVRFRGGQPLPSGYGVSLDARIIEIPWVLSRLVSSEGAKLLDAGSSFNHAFILESPLLRGREISILTLAPERECYSFLGVSYHYGDLRNTIFRDACFDEIVCVSTIEHVGLDNTMYAGANAAESDPSGFRSAIREFRRILKPGGRLFLTVPFGRYENHGWFQQFDAMLLDEMIREFDPSTTTEMIYRYLPAGWQISGREDASHCAFFNVRSTGAPSRAKDERQAAEGAVVCVEMIAK